MESERIPRSGIAYICVSTLLAGFVVWLSLRTEIAGSSPHWIWFAVILACSMAAEIYPVVSLAFGPSQVELSVSLALTFAVACIWSPLPAMALVFLQTVSGDIITHKSLTKIIFNATLYVTVIGGTSLIYHYYDVAALGFLEGRNLLALLLAAAYYVVSEWIILSGLFAVLEHRSPFSVIVSFIRQTSLNLAALLPLGAVIAVLFRENPLVFLFLAPTFFLLYYSLKREQMLRSQTQSILEKLVDVLESKSPETARHSKRVRDWVVVICEDLGMESSVTDTVIQAAVLHDLGKVGLDDSLLRKPGLTADEFHQIMEHPGVSAGLMEGLTLFEEGRSIVLHHHERYDGNGYPDHLKGDDIPLGARIIAVADSFDAMVSVRPYRARSLSITEAVGILEDEKGAQFDPALVTGFIKLVRTRVDKGDFSNFPVGVRV
jgi:hypothetical protein